MKTKRIVIVVISIILLLFGCWKKEAAVNSEIQTVKKLSMENPYKNMEKSVNDKDVYARGKHVTITKKEMEWQMEVFKLNGSQDAEKDAYNYICKFKTLYYHAAENGFIATDEELDAAIKTNLEIYEEMKKEGETDPLYEMYGGAKKI